MIRSWVGRTLAAAVAVALGAGTAGGTTPSAAEATSVASGCDDPYAGAFGETTFRSLPAPGRTVQPGDRIVYWMTVEVCQPLSGASLTMLVQDIVEVVSIKPVGQHYPDYGTGEPGDPLEPFGLVNIDWSRPQAERTGFRGNLTIRIRLVHRHIRTT
ncbi:hypothetical protein [Thalassiella azotivora]